VLDCFLPKACGERRWLVQFVKREIRRIGRNSDEVYDVNDVREFLDQYKEAYDTAQKKGGSKPKWVAVVAHTVCQVWGRMAAGSHQ